MQVQVAQFTLFKPREKRHAGRAMPDPNRPVRPDHAFASDNAAGLAPEALAALAAANAGAVPSYGEDDWTRRARELVCAVFEADAEVFLVGSGTAANALALAAVCRGYQGILCHECSHVDTDEGGAPEFFTGGAKVMTVAGPGGKLAPAAVAAALRRRTDVHYPRAAVLSLTQATEWGTVYTPDEVRALCAVAKSHGLAVQMDGARFANAAAAVAARGVRPADLTWRAGVDVLSLGGTKNGMLATEAVVFFNRELARDFDCRLKQSAQLPRSSASPPRSGSACSRPARGCATPRTPTPWRNGSPPRCGRCRGSRSSPRRRRTACLSNCPRRRRRRWRRGAGSSCASSASMATG